MELAAARQEGFVSKQSSDMKRTNEKGPVIVIGIFTRFGRKNERDAIRKAWMSTGRVSVFITYLANFLLNLHIDHDVLNSHTVFFSTPQPEMKCHNLSWHD